jgi:acyl-CoA synthetase (AMP-forming)/AMP-acid ligase II
LLALDELPLTYRALDAHMNQVRDRLRELGIAQEDRVALVLEDSLDAAATLLAVMSAAVATPLHETQPPNELERDLRRLAASLLVANTGRAPAAADIAVSIGLPIIAATDIGASDAATAPARESRESLKIDPDAIMLIAHTSGTTALPKRAPISHGMQLAAARARNRRRGFGPDDRALLLAPLSSVMFLTNLITMLVAGGSAIVMSDLAPASALRANHELQPTWILAVLPVYSAMLQSLSRDPEKARNPRLRLVNWGGAGADPALAARLTAAFGVPSDGSYGLSEASAVATPGRPGTDKPGSVGVATACAIRIIDEAGQSLPANESGEIVIRGPSLFRGYLDDPEATAAAFTADGWFRTGDLGRLDVDGFLFVEGRMKDQINRGGVKIAPAEVEAVLLSHPIVAEAAVFAVPDMGLGEDAVAAIVLRPGMSSTQRELRAWMLDRLAMSKVPRRIWCVPSLPRTETGKLQRTVLARLWQERDT